VIVTADATAGTGIANVQFKLDGNDLGEKASSAPYSVSWDTTQTSNGSHTLTAVATDKAGVSATATTITITVMNPSITAVSASNVSSSATTIRWTTDEGSDTQVDYGTTTAYGASTALNTARVTSHTQTLSGLAAGTLYHFRVRSRNASGNLAVSGDFTFTTGAAAVSGGAPQGVVWTGLANATATANSLKKTGGCGGCDDAGGYSQQQIASGNGYVQFTASEVAALRFVGLSRNAAGTRGPGINFAIRLQSGRARSGRAAPTAPGRCSPPGTPSGSRSNPASSSTRRTGPCSTRVGSGPSIRSRSTRRSSISVRRSAMP
jgi:hypothetical protein